MNTIQYGFLCPACGAEIDCQGFCRCYGGNSQAWSRNVITGNWDRLSGDNNASV